MANITATATPALPMLIDVKTFDRIVLRPPPPFVIEVRSRSDEELIELKDPARVEGEGPVAGFVLDLKRIYDQLDT
jgi:hypothetical protein